MQGTMKRAAVYIMMAVFIILSLVDIGATGSEQGEKMQWKLVIEMNQEQIRSAQMTAAHLTASMQTLRVSSSLKDRHLELSGAHNLEELRTILFKTAARWADFLGGPVELTLEMPADNPFFILQMEARMTAGYRWEILPAARSRFFQSGESAFIPRYRGYGAPSIQTLQIHSRGVGDSTLTLVYRRPFQRNAPIKAKLNISVTGVSDLIELSDPTPSEPKSEIVIPDNDEPNLSIEFQDKGVPASWDWRTQIPNIVPEVRDQAACGSCWAFGTVGVMESALKKGGGPLTDLSEQFLISCNSDGWGCNGGLTANKYHYDTLGENQTVVGAVLESDKPYAASNGTCTVAYTHPYKLYAWQFITGSEWTMPTNDQLKNAIYTYGPITAGVCADSGWDSYTGGIYAPGSNQCGGSTNHQIILVGWDDSTKSWILRNSWGDEWGEKGYMRIRYDPTGSTSRVGEGTSWVTYQSQVCTYSISPASATGSTSGGSGSVAVTASAGNCAWTATSASWITVTSGSAGTGNGTVNYSYTPNNTGSARTSAITIAGQTFTLTQEKSFVDPHLLTGSMNGIPESSYTWGDGIHNLTTQWSIYAADWGLIWLYGSDYAWGLDFYVAKGVTDPTIVGDAAVFTYTKGIGPALEGDTIFFRGANGYYGAWRIHDVYAMNGNNYLNGQWYFQSNGTGYFGPHIQVTPIGLDFGDVLAGSTRDLFLKVKNAGSGILTGNGTAAAPFGIVSGGSYSLGADQEQIVAVRYQPMSAGTHTGVVVFTGGAGANVPVTGTGLTETTDCSGGAVVLQNTMFVSGKTYHCTATISITAGTGVTVQSGATVNFRAPVINIQAGFKVENGAVFSAKQ